MLLFLGACGSGGNSSSSGGGVVANAIDSVGNFLKGNVTGEVDKVYSTEWFNFAVRSIEKVDEYAGYSAEEGFILLDVVVEELNTFSEDIPMGTFDFYLDSDTFIDYIFPLDPLDDTMMPTEFSLSPSEDVKYHLLYEIPDGVADLRLMYTEIDEEDNEGATFTITVPE
jgi:hypothetical protein